MGIETLTSIPSSILSDSICSGEIFHCSILYPSPRLIGRSTVKRFDFLSFFVNPRYNSFLFIFFDSLLPEGEIVEEFLGWFKGLEDAALLELLAAATWTRIIPSDLQMLVLSCHLIENEFTYDTTPAKTNKPE